MVQRNGDNQYLVPMVACSCHICNEPLIPPNKQISVLLYLAHRKGESTVHVAVAVVGWRQLDSLLDSDLTVSPHTAANIPDSNNK